MDAELRDHARQDADPGQDLGHWAALHRAGRLERFQGSDYWVRRGQGRRPGPWAYDPAGPGLVWLPVRGLRPESWQAWQASSTALAGLEAPRVLCPPTLGSTGVDRFQRFVVPVSLPNEVAPNGWLRPPLDVRLGWVRMIGRATVAAQAAGFALGGVERFAEGVVLRRLPHEDAPNLEADGQSIGLPFYMHAEVLRGTPRTVGGDQEQLGLLLYIALTGQHPAWAGRADGSGGSLQDFVLAVTRGQFPKPQALNPAADPSLEQVCLRALRHESAEASYGHSGYATARAFLADLDRAQAGTLPERTSLLRRWWQRWRGA